MCGIIGYTGKHNAVPKLTAGLSALEYRGYDSAGIAIFSDEGIGIIKEKGRLANLEKALAARECASRCGIGHTRWATHGIPSRTNSHPHRVGRTVVVHNGIIENYDVIRRNLSDTYDFITQTDTESACALIDYMYTKYNDPVKAVFAAAEGFTGSFALGIMFSDIPGKIFATRRDNPLIIGKAEHGAFIASDIPAILGETDKYYRIPDGELAILDGEKITFLDADANPTEKTLLTVTWDTEAAQKGGYEHFMLKEIHDEPVVVAKTVKANVRGGLSSFDCLSDSTLSSLERIHIVACGTAMHAGLAAKSLIEKLARVPVLVEVASEFRYNDPILTPRDLVILISQSGETADTLAALRLAKGIGAFTLSFVNVVGSSVARESDAVIYTLAGPEIAVASTKAYSTQLAVLYLFAFRLAHVKGLIPAEKLEEYTRVLEYDVPEKISQVLEGLDDIRAVAEKYAGAEDAFFIGRGVDYVLCEEASLKLKEVSYIHSEAYPAGELKHGTISLIAAGVPTVAIATDYAVFDKMISNVKEVKARGGSIILICANGLECDPEVYDDMIRLPEINPLFSPFVCAAVFQAFAYYTAVIRGCDVDKPRNLAKSVTVE